MLGAWRCYEGGDGGEIWSDGPGCIALGFEFYGCCGGEGAAMKAMGLRRP
jgi:hypothetical protein